MEIATLDLFLRNTTTVDTIEDRMTDDSLVAIFQQIDCGSLFKTVRLVSRDWCKTADITYPAGNEIFADNENTVIYLNGNYESTYLIKWSLKHNIEINAQMIEKITRGFDKDTLFTRPQEWGYAELLRSLLDALFRL